MDQAEGFFILDQAEGFFNKALEYDSAFAQAYSGLARVYWNKYHWRDYFEEGGGIHGYCDISG